MAGSRKASGKPLKRVSSAQRLREQLRAELATLTDPRDRVIAAADYVRAALARRPGRADVADEVVEELMGAGDRILELERGAA
jgi:hypothetical protein